MTFVPIAVLMWMYMSMSFGLIEKTLSHDTSAINYFDLSSFWSIMLKRVLFGVVVLGLIASHYFFFATFVVICWFTNEGYHYITRTRLGFINGMSNMTAFKSFVQDMLFMVFFGILIYATSTTNDLTSAFGFAGALIGLCGILIASNAFLMLDILKNKRYPEYEYGGFLSILGAMVSFGVIIYATFALSSLVAFFIMVPVVMNSLIERATHNFNKNQKLLNKGN